MLREIQTTFSPLWRLGRFDKPIAIALLLFPCWWGIALQSGPDLPLDLLIIFALGAIFLRAAGCIVNDAADRAIDRQVTRTRDRPLASGELSIHSALIFLLILLLTGLAVLLMLPWRCWGLSFLAAVMATIYPFTKRWIPFPQLVLGFTYNMGVFIGTAAVTPEWLTASTISLYAAAICWTLAYDTIYALQDREDDTRLGVGSTAVLFGRHVKYAVAGFYGIMHLLILIAINQNAITLSSSSLPFKPLIIYALLLISLTYILYRLSQLKIQNVSQCREFFVQNQWVGMLVFLALLI